MQPTECLLAKCPHCKHKKKIMQLMSGNTFGATLWSDSKQVAPMLPTPSPIQKCPNCGHFYELRKVKLKQGSDLWGETGWLQFDDAIDAYNELPRETPQEREQLTIIFTWAFNDIYRFDHTPTPEQFDTFKRVISECLQLPIFTAPDQTLIKAELYREIGMFDKCISILNDYNPGNEFELDIKNKIIEKAEANDTKVFKLIDGRNRF